MQELTGLSYELCLFLAWFCFTAFTFYSGSKGVILTDTMMFMVFLIATIIAGPYVFKAQGGIGHLLENLMNNPNIRRTFWIIMAIFQEPGQQMFLVQ